MENLSFRKISKFNYSHLQSDEIDAKELLISLWKGKVVILLTGVAFFVIAFFYASMQDEAWIAKAKINPPRNK